MSHTPYLSTRFKLATSIFLAIALFDVCPLLAQEEFKGTIWLLKRPNFVYVNGRCVIKGTFEDRQRPLYQQGRNLQGGTGQNVSQMTIQDSVIQGESFIVGDSSEPVGEEVSNTRKEVGTFTDVFNGSLTSDGQFEGTVNTTYYRAGQQICSLSGSFTLTRVSGSVTTTSQIAASNVPQLDRPTFESRFRAAPTEKAVVLFEQQQTAAVTQQLGLKPPSTTPTVNEISQKLYQLEQETDKKPAVSYVVALKDRLDIIIVLPKQKPAFKVQIPFLDTLKTLNPTSFGNNSAIPARRITLKATQADIQELA